MTRSSHPVSQKIPRPPCCSLQSDQITFFLLSEPRGQLIQPSSGSARYHETKIIYTPEGGFCGTDKFTYTILDFDKEYSDSAEVTVEVKCPEAAESQGCPSVSDDFAVTYTNESVVVPVMDNDEFVPSGK